MNYSAQEKINGLDKIIGELNMCKSVEECANKINLLEEWDNARLWCAYHESPDSRFGDILLVTLSKMEFGE